jgi:hypothetical protein
VSDKNESLNDYIGQIDFQEPTDGEQMVEGVEFEKSQFINLAESQEKVLVGKQPNTFMNTSTAGMQNISMFSKGTPGRGSELGMTKRTTENLRYL